MLRLAARRLADLRFARFPQPQPANPRNRAPVAIGQLQLRQRFPIATALHRRTHAQLTRSARQNRNLRPLKRQQQRTVADALDLLKTENMQRRIKQRRMQAVLLRR